MDYIDDTIVGISTAQATGAISIVRLSGQDAIKIVKKIFKGKDLETVPSHTITYGHIINPTNKQIIDEVLVSIFLAPKSYTTENVVEINCHGGLFVTNQIYEQVILAGARPATAGEFTKRAYLAGRIDLTKAEAVMDVIEAENKEALKIATSALNGKINTFVEEKRKELLDLIAVIAVNIDYPEYDDVEEITNEKILPKLKQITKELEQTLEDTKSAKLLKNGINVALVGKPNVGKSSLLNTLLKENKAIVTNVPGTTRDIVEASIQLKNLTLNLIDTAGIRKTSDIVEQIGVQKSVDAINKADLILFILDGNTNFTKEDEEIYNLIKDKCHIVIINKSDLNQNITLDQKLTNNSLKISTLTNENIELLEEKIVDKLNLNNIKNKDITYISNARQIEKLNNAYLALKEALEVINDGMQTDFVDIYLNKAWLYLGEIIGETTKDDLLDELFSKFCLGK